MMGHPNRCCIFKFKTRVLHAAALVSLGAKAIFPGQFQDIHSPDKLNDHDIVAGTLKVFIPPRKKPRRNVYLYQKGDFDSMRRDS